MDKKTKILASVFGAMLLYVVISKTIYPWLVEPLVTLGDRVSKSEVELDKLQDKQDEVSWALRDYRRLMDRVGSGDIGKVENAVRQQINKLFLVHKFEEYSTTPTKPHADRKTSVIKMTLTVTAVGSLASVVSFLRDVSELPQLVRVGNVSIFPKSTSRRGKQVNREQVNLRVPLELWLLPQHKMLEGKIADAELEQPEKVVRHLGRDYSSIWERTPFTEFIPYDPLIAIAGKNRSVTVGKKLSLAGSARGGDGQYAFVWSGDSGLSGVDTKRPTVNTAKLGSYHYILEVADHSGHVSTAQITVDVIAEKVVEAAPIKPPAPPTPPVAPIKRRMRWADGKQMKIQVALVRHRVDGRTGEIQIYNTKRRERSYYATGDELDGGTLVFVHPRAVLVRWEDEFYVYPVGSKISDDVQIAEATDYPRFQLLADQILAAEKVVSEASKASKDDAVGIKTPGGEAMVGPPPPETADRAVTKPVDDGLVQQGNGSAVGHPEVVPVVTPANSGEVKPVKTGIAHPVARPRQSSESNEPQASSVKKRPHPVNRRPRQGRRTKKFRKGRGRR